MIERLLKVILVLNRIYLFILFMLILLHPPYIGYINTSVTPNNINLGPRLEILNIRLYYKLYTCSGLCASKLTKDKLVLARSRVVVSDIVVVLLVLYIRWFVLNIGHIGLHYLVPSMQDKSGY